MTRELFVSDTIGNTDYAVLRVGTNKRGVGEGGNIGMWWNGTTLAWEEFNAPDWVNYAIALTELGATGFFQGDMPTGFPINEKAVEVYYYQRVGATPAQGDTKLTGARFEYQDEWVAVSALEV